MTPEDIRTQRFTARLLHGVSPEEVSAFLEDVAEAFSNLQTANASLIERVKLLEAQVDSRRAREPQPASPSPGLQEEQAREREASASSHIEVLRAAALREVEALLHGAQVRAQAVVDEALERDAAMRQDAEAARTRTQAEADELLTGATARAEALLTTAQEQETAIRHEIDRLTQSRLQLLDDIRGNLEAYQEWLVTMDPRGRARGRREPVADGVASVDEARVS